jgi:hypothetical protein
MNTSGSKPVSVKRKLMEEAGVAVVGSSSTKVKQATVTFSSPFTTVPVVVATTLQDTAYPAGSITDTFAVSITGVTTTKFTANVVRVDAGPGWGQNLRLGYSATTP